MIAGIALVALGFISGAACMFFFMLGFNKLSNGSD